MTPLGLQGGRGGRIVVGSTPNVRATSTSRVAISPKPTRPEGPYAN